jgi:hypothetical protein
VHEAFDDNFFDWWARQIPAIEDYPYTGIIFLRDIDMPMPPSEECREIGTHHYLYFKVILFLVFKYYPFYGNIIVLT